MRRFYTLALSAAAILSASAQQLPNTDFEGEWSDCVPYTYYGSEGYTDQLSQVVVGQNPANWVISNVAGMASYYDGNAMGLGSTQVGDKTEGYNSETAVKLTNTANPFMATQIVPAYLTLGTTWSTANPALQADWTMAINNSDGGSFGGMAFTGRPKGLEFMYKRTRGEAKPDEKSTVVAYLWKGHWTQKNVPVIIYMAGDPVYADMVDRDRCVLGYDMTGCQGGEVEHTDDAELIAVINAEITQVSDEWAKFSADFDYKSDATPEMINIVIASGDYFGGADVVGNGNSLIVDDVKLVYDEAEAEGDVYEGTVSIDMGGEPVEVPGEVHIIPNVADVEPALCTFVLPNFSLGEGMDLGDIKIENVTMTPTADGYSYVGEAKGLSLMGGAILANVNVSGTTTKDGVCTMDIPVLWIVDPVNDPEGKEMGMNIAVKFNGQLKGTTAIEAVEVEAAAPAEYYNLNGVRVNAGNLVPGIYIKRQGNKASKVYVK